MCIITPTMTTTVRDGVGSNDDSDYYDDNDKVIIIIIIIIIMANISLISFTVTSKGTATKVGSVQKRSVNCSNSSKQPVTRPSLHVYGLLPSLSLGMTLLEFCRDLWQQKLCRVSGYRTALFA